MQHKKQKTKEKVLSQNFSKPFCLLFFVDPTACFAKGGFKGCGENPNSPRFLVLFRIRKRTQLCFETIFERNCVIKYIFPYDTLSPKITETYFCMQTLQPLLSLPFPSHFIIKHSHSITDLFILLIFDFNC